MGIKFLCPNGHKINVKSFLAGKKGICPRCGVRVDIPLESTITKDDASNTDPAPEAESLEAPSGNPSWISSIGPTRTSAAAPVFSVPTNEPAAGLGDSPSQSKGPPLLASPLSEAERELDLEVAFPAQEGNGL